VPIRPENKARYPADWAAVRERIRARAGDRCEWCGVPNSHWVVRLAGGGWQAGRRDRRAAGAGRGVGGGAAGSTCRTSARPAATWRPKWPTG
jgi:hypothetical protein